MPGSEAMVPHQAPLAYFPEDRPSLLLPRLFKRWGSLCGDHPEIQHERMHCADQGDR
jgi:hypothetical protein